MSAAKRRRIFEFLLVSLLAILVAAGNLFQVIYHAFHRPPNSVFLGITHWYEDYFFYLSQFTQGADGAWLATNKFTTENLPPAVTWMFNVILGKVGWLVGLTPWTTNILAIFVLSVSYVWLLWAVARRLFPQKPSMAVSTLLLAILSNSFFRIETANGTAQVVPYIYFYNYTAALNRLGGVPHLIAQSLLSLLLLVIIADISEQLIGRRPAVTKSLFTRCLTGAMVAFVLFIINPVYVFVDAVVIGLFFLIAALSKPHVRTWVIFGGVGSLIFLPTIPLLFWQLSAFSHPFYRFFRQWETSIPPTDLRTFILSSGVLAILVPLGIISFWKNYSRFRLLGALFALVPIIIYFSPLPAFLQIPSFRVLQPPAYIFLAAMGIEGLLTISRLAGKLPGNRWQSPAFALLFSLVLVLQLPVFWQEFNNRSSDVILASSLNHVERDTYNALGYLSSLPKDKAVLAIDTVELLVPAISGHTVYAGHRSLTYNYADKIGTVALFYTMAMKPEEGENFLSQNNIGYVIWPTYRGAEGEFAAYYPFLKIAYQNPKLVVLIKQ